MKKTLFALLLTLAFLPALPAQDPVTVGLKWDASISSNVEGYRLYMRKAGVESWGQPIATTAATVLTVPSVALSEAATYEFIVKAFNATGESGPSNLVTYTPLFPGQNLRIVVSIEATAGGSTGNTP